MENNVASTWQDLLDEVFPDKEMQEIFHRVMSEGFTRQRVADQDRP